MSNLQDIKGLPAAFRKIKTVLTSLETRLAAAIAGSIPVTHIDAGASGTAGSVDIFPGTAAKGKTAFTSTDNAGNTTTAIVVGAQAGARTYTVPDAGASATFALFSKVAEAANAVTVVPGTNMLSTAGTTVLTLDGISDQGGEFNLVSVAAQNMSIDFGVGVSVYGAGIAGTGGRYVKFTNVIGTSAKVVKLSSTSYYILSAVGAVTIAAAP